MVNVVLVLLTDGNLLHNALARMTSLRTRVFIRSKVSKVQIANY